MADRRSDGGDLEVDVRCHRPVLSRPGLRGVMLMAVGTPLAAGLDAWAQRLGHDLFDGAGAAAALRATAQAPIHLPRRARKIGPGGDVGHDSPNIMVAKDVTGTDDHETQRLRMALVIDMKVLSGMQKEKHLFLRIPNCF